MSSPLSSESLRSNPTQQAYLVRRTGQDILVTRAEARQWFQQGYAVLDPQTRNPVDVGAVSVPDFAEGRGAFVREEEEERRAREELEKGW